MRLLKGNLFIISFSIVDCLHGMYAHILKRLDDSSDDVRMKSTETLVAYVK